jgi:hypothetical protein
MENIMKIIRTSLLLASIIVSFSFADNLMNFVIGPTWPKLLQESDVHKSEKKTVMWNGAFEMGRVFDKKFIVGGKIDFGWNILKHYDDEDKSKIDYKDKLFMIPISAFFALDPIPEFMLHPLARIQVGYNQAFYNKMVEDTSGLDIDPLTPVEMVDSDDNGYYFGFIVKFGADAVLDLGKHASLFVGVEYQVSRIRNSSNHEVNMNAPGIRMGVSTLF